jgi:hypothetical protein
MVGRIYIDREVPDAGTREDGDATFRDQRAHKI